MSSAPRLIGPAGSRWTLALLCLLAIFAAAGAASADEFYRWQDDRGRWHFSDSPYDVPAQHRDQIESLRDDFDESASVSVVDGLDERYAPDSPPGGHAPEGAEAAPGGFDWTQLQKMKQGGGPSPAEMLAQVPTGVKLAIAFGLVVMIGVALLMGGWLLKVACHFANEEAPAIGKAMLIVFIQGLVATTAQMTLQVALLSDPSTITPTRAFGVMGLNMIVGFSLYVAVLRGMLTETLGKAFVVQILVFLIAMVTGVVLAVSGLVLSCAVA